MKTIAHAFVAAAATLLSGAAMAAACDVEIEGTDAMRFNKDVISVPASCKSFEVKLKHTGKLAKAAMGHNVVISKTADVQGIATDGIAAGVDKNYLKPGDARVIATTKLIGGGESDSIKFDPKKLKAGEEYSFFCSFPGHASLMKGKVTLVK
jgi:azurin